MKVLLVGVGGVGEAIAVIAKDKPWVEKLVLCRLQRRPGQRGPGQGGLAGAHAGGVHRRGRQGADRGAGAQARGRPHPQRRGPGVQRGHLRRRLRGRLQLHGHGHDPVHPSCDRPLQHVRRQAGRLPVRAGRGLGEEGPAGLGGHGRRAGHGRRVRQVRREAPVRRDRGDRRPRRRQPGGARLRVRPQLLHLDHHRGVPQPAGDLGGRQGLVHHRSRSPSRRCSTSPRASVRWSASTWSTRKCCWCRAGSSASGSPSSTAWATSSSTCSRPSRCSASTTASPSTSRACKVAPRDVVAACLPDPAHLGDQMFGKTCAGTWVKGTKDGKPRQVYLYQVADNETCMKKYGVQAVVWQTAVSPVIAWELLADRGLEGRGRARAGSLRPRSVHGADAHVRLPLGAQGDEGLTWAWPFDAGASAVPHPPGALSGARVGRGSARGARRDAVPGHPLERVAARRAGARRVGARVGGLGPQGVGQGGPGGAGERRGIAAAGRGRQG